MCHGHLPKQGQQDLILTGCTDRCRTAASHTVAPDWLIAAPFRWPTSRVASRLLPGTGLARTRATHSDAGIHLLAVGRALAALPARRLCISSGCLAANSGAPTRRTLNHPRPVRWPRVAGLAKPDSPVL